MAARERPHATERMAPRLPPVSEIAEVTAGPVVAVAAL